MPPCPSKPPVLLVTLLKDNALYQKASPKELLAGLKAARYPTIIIGSVNRFMDALATKPPPRAVLVQDAALAFSGMLKYTKALVEYTRNGGTVLVGWDFANHVLEPEIEAFFELWDLPWKAGSYFRTTVHRNKGIKQDAFDPAGLCDSYSVKSFSLLDVAPEHALYRPSDKSHVESHVFPEDFCPVDVHECAVAVARVGKGLIGYSGDVNSEKDTTKAFLAMLGLGHSFIVSPLGNPYWPLGKAIHDASKRKLMVFSDAIRQAGCEMYSGSRVFGDPPVYGTTTEVKSRTREGRDPPLSPSACQACGKDAGLQCGRCRKVKYCGAPHQRQDWKYHKWECKA